MNDLLKKDMQRYGGVYHYFSVYLENVSNHLE